MKRGAIIAVLLMLSMSLSVGVAEIPAPNDTNGNEYLSVDGYVVTKFASVGSEVEISALTRGHSDSTLVTAEILKYDIDPVEIIDSVSIPQDGTVIDMVSLQRSGAHEEDANTMTWDGVYTIPVNALGGVYGARIIAEDGCCLRAVDDPTQLTNVLRNEVEKVFVALDDTWQEISPADDISWEFESLKLIVDNHGGWSNFVDTASEGDAQSLWDGMISAGHDQYDMSAGANFLEALIDFLDSDDADASVALVQGLLTYLHDFPLPRSFDDFDEVVEYLQAFDPIENFTRFEGTGDFEAAYNAMLGSDEWNAMENALDDLLNNRKPFESIQTIMHNIALLSVSIHPEAIANALEAYVTPLMEGDFDSMTGFQKLLVRWAEMAEYLDGETDMQDTNGDDIPDNIIWQYEKLLETPEGQAWTAQMASGNNWVNDAFDNFNSLPEDILGHVLDAAGKIEDSDLIPALEAFGEWIEDASFGDDWAYWPDYGDEEDDEDGRQWGSSDSIEFNFDDIVTSKYDRFVLDLEITLQFWGDIDDEEKPDKFSISMSDGDGTTVSTDLVREEDWGSYIGRLTTPSIKDAEWTLSEPMKNYDSSNVDNAEMRINNMLPSMLESMLWENNDEIFMVSALGVLVEQDETVKVSSSYNVETLTYDAAGPVQGAEVDIAVVRASPQTLDDLEEAVEPGEVDLTVESPSTLQGRYMGGNLDGDISAIIQSMGTWDDDEDEEGREDPQAIYLEEDIEIAGQGSLWDASSQLPYPDRGLVEVVTEGVTTDGLEFRVMQQIPLPGSLGCARTEANTWSGDDIGVNWNYEQFWLDDSTSFDKPELVSLEIDWGDGQTDQLDNTQGDIDQGSRSHDYAQDGQYTITVEFKGDNDATVSHEYNYQKSDDGETGLWEDGWEEEDGGYYGSWDYQGGNCYLYEDYESTPSPAMIDTFISEGPVEVMKEEIYTSNADGAASMTITPTIPGVYTSIVQSKVTRADGETMTGIGFNLVGVTEAAVTLGGLESETTIAGMPVYSVDSGNNGLATITLNSDGLAYDDGQEYRAWMGIAPVDFGVLFPDVDIDTEPEEWEIEFQNGDTSRSQEVRINAPLSMIVVAIFDSENEMFPVAIHAGVLMSDPGALDLTGSLGPGQVTNVALDSNGDPASRILAFAAPRQGFDPASIDLSSFSGLVYGEGVRENVDWISAEQRNEEVCYGLDASFYDDDGANLHLSISSEYSRYADSDEYMLDVSDIQLLDSDGNVVSPEDDWSESEWEWDDSYGASYNIDADSDEVYTLETGIDFAEYEIRISEESHDEEEDHDHDDGETYKYADVDDSWRCSSDRFTDEDDEFALLDDFMGDLNSVAWGVGSSADLKLPVLASPKDAYTVLAVAQQGDGESARMVTAIGSQISVPNPLPPEIQNLTLGFSPPNPMPGDSVVVAVYDESGQPVEGLSVLVIRDSMTLFSVVTDYDGQATFTIPTGTLLVRVGGGMFNNVEMTLIVEDSGVTLEDGSTLPADENVGGSGDGNEDDCVELIPGMGCDDEGESGSKSSGDEAAGGFLPAPSLFLTTLVLLGAGLLSRRSKDD